MAKSLQRAYPRLIGGLPDPSIKTPYVGVMEMQKIINQMCDWIFQLQGGGGGGGSVSVYHSIATAALNLGHSAVEIEGTTLIVPSGKYWISGVFALLTVAGTGIGYGLLFLNGSVVSGSSALGGGTGITVEVTCVQNWVLNLPAGGKLSLAAGIAGVGPGAQALSGATSITALRVGDAGSESEIEVTKQIL